MIRTVRREHAGESCNTDVWRRNFQADQLTSVTPPHARTPYDCTVVTEVYIHLFGINTSTLHVLPNRSLVGFVLPFMVVGARERDVCTQEIGFTVVITS